MTDNPKERDLAGPDTRRRSEKKPDPPVPYPRPPSPEALAKALRTKKTSKAS